MALTLSYVAEKERLSIRERQAQGIAAAKAAGKPLGRPRAEYPEEWNKYYTAWQKGEITATKAMEELGMKRTTFYKLVKSCKIESKGRGV